MDIETDFIELAALVGEPKRAQMLWNLLDGRAYTATELAACADISLQSTSNHLSKLLDGNILCVERQGRHRYYRFARPDAAYAIEALASLVNIPPTQPKQIVRSGVRYCRTCYDHLAGTVGVLLTTTMLERDILIKNEDSYSVTKFGTLWLEEFGLSLELLKHSRRAFARQCLDWSERQPHLAGSLGAALLATMIEKQWLRRVQFSREITITSTGKSELYEMLGVTV